MSVLRCALRPIVLYLVSLAISLPSYALAALPSDLALKAALLFKLPRFTYLPHLEGSEHLQLCILGHNPFGNVLQALVHTPIDGRQVRIDIPSSAHATAHCNLVYIPQSDEAQQQLAHTMQALAKHPVLTISDIPGFAQAHGMVELASHPEGNGRLQIIINQSAAARQGIKFNAQLLRLAHLLP